MTVWLHIVAMVLLASLGAALWRVWRGPSQADRMMAAQLTGSGGVAVLIVLAALQDWTLLIVALALALLAALAAVGFVQADTPDGAGDPEELPPAEDKPPHDPDPVPAPVPAPVLATTEKSVENGAGENDGAWTGQSPGHAGNEPPRPAVGGLPPKPAAAPGKPRSAAGHQQHQPAAAHLHHQTAAGPAPPRTDKGSA